MIMNEGSMSGEGGGMGDGEAVSCLKEKTMLWLEYQYEAHQKGAFTSSMA